MAVNLAKETNQWIAHNALQRPNLVSVIIPCYNQAQFLGEAIESVLAQSYSHHELIVVDDGSTDDSAKIAKRYSTVRYFYQGNAGLSCARNTGLRQSRGRFLVFLDADDRLLPHALETNVRSMHKHPECAFVSGHCRVIDANGAILPSPRQRRVEREHYLELLRGGTYIWCPATVIYQRRVFDFVQGFDPALRCLEDYDLYLRITRDFPVSCHDQIIAEYRQHRSNMSRDVSQMQNAALAAHKAQWHFAKTHRRYRQAYLRGKLFWRNDYPLQQIVTRTREIVREQLPQDASVAVATAGNPEFLRLDGRRARHFPEADEKSRGELFAQGAAGSAATAPWIEAGMAYEFSLYGGSRFCELLARLLVRGIPAGFPAARIDFNSTKVSCKNGALLKAIPNPVPVEEEPGTTNVIWDTGDGSDGQVYVSSGGVYPGTDPIDSDEAWRRLESARQSGVQYLIVPAKSFWWHAHYEKFRRRVEHRYPTIVRAENTCIIFDLREPSQ